MEPTATEHTTHRAENGTPLGNRPTGGAAPL